MNTVRNSVPMEAARAVRAGASEDAGRSVGGGDVIGGASMRAGYRMEGRQAGPSPPGARGASFVGAGELVLPEHQADGGGVGRQRSAEQRLHDLRLLADALREHRHVVRRAALEA